MSEEKTSQNTESTATDNSKPKKNPISTIITLAIVAYAIFFVFADFSRFAKILAVLAGFGAVIFIHELGHFTAAKSVGIIVEAFSIGFGPVVLGFKKCKAGMQIKILPTIIPGNDGMGKLGFLIPRKSDKDGETDYRISLIPLGGYVAMLGQADLGADQKIENPRAYSNKPVWARAWAISAGVLFNMISAGIAFIFIFNSGIDMEPPVAGYIPTNTAYYQGGGRSGDKILEINGEKKDHLMYMDLKIASAFSNNKAVNLKVQRVNGTIEDLSITPIMNEEIGAKLMGLNPASTLKINKFTDEESLEKLQAIGLEPGDEITAVNGTDISHGFELFEVLYPESGKKSPDKVILTIKRNDTKHEITLPMKLTANGITEMTYKSMIHTVLGLKPKLVALNVMPNTPAEKAGILKNDVIERIGNQAYPSFDEATAIIEASADKELTMIVSRIENDVTVEKEIIITPKAPGVSLIKRLFGVKNTAKIGLAMSSTCTDNTIVAKCEEYEHGKALAIPRGAAITTVGQTEVTNYAEIIDAMLANTGKEIAIGYKTDMQEGQVTATVPENNKWIGLKYEVDSGDVFLLAAFEPLKHNYKAEDMGEALSMGWNMTENFISQTFATIQGMANRSVSPKAASGPVGILKMSYQVVSEKSFVDYIYFMAMISVCIAVFNFLPLPILDGGLLVLLIIEKIKGSPVSTKIQEVLVWAGLLMIGTLFLYITFNDIKRLFEQ
ncbi:MAG: site-2 protease family protein [Phycisphaerae bacterium]|nr:site-2 protease family protein [Phycisphaerae bacterium]